MSSFFTAPTTQKKRKRASGTDAPRQSVKFASKPAPAPKKGPARERILPDDDSISGSDSNSGDEGDRNQDSAAGSSSEDEGETAGEKRLRVAARYLDSVRREVDEAGFDAADIDRDLIAERLQEDASEAHGKAYRRIASDLAFDRASHTFFTSDNLTTTSVAVCPPYCYSVHKDMSLVKWRLQDLPSNQFQTSRKKSKKLAPPRRRPVRVAHLKGSHKKANDKNYKGHTGEILAVAASADGKYVVTAGADRRLIVHEARTLKSLRVFTHHRDAVTSLVFRRGTNYLYSASADRTVKTWGIDEMTYVETLYGHADKVVDIDALALERCISVGSRDRSARVWKILDETQLVFRGGAVGKKARPDDTDPMSLAQEGSMDRVAQLDEEHFVTGSDNGNLCLFSIQKKKPLCVLGSCHGFDPPLKPNEASAEEHPDPKFVPPPQPRYITALRALPYSDLFLSGSWEGCVRVWRLSEDKRKIEPAGILGNTSECMDSEHSHRQTNGVLTTAMDRGGVKVGEGKAEGPETSENVVAVQEQDKQPQRPWLIKGVINDIAVFERGERGKDGLCVVVAVGKEHRLGKWMKIKDGKNGAVVFEVPRKEKITKP